MDLPMTPAANRSKCAWEGNFPGTDIPNSLFDTVQPSPLRSMTCCPRTALGRATDAKSRAVSVQSMLAQTSMYPRSQRSPEVELDTKTVPIA